MIAAIAASLLSLGCKKKELSSTIGTGPTKVVLTLDWKPEPEFGGFFAAKQVGAFSRHGLDVAIKSGGEGAPTTTLVANGLTDFATTAADQVILARSAGADVVAIFAVYQTSPQGIMVHKARGFTKLEDVFTHPGTLAAENNNWLKFLLQQYGKPSVGLTSYSGGIAVFLAKTDYSHQCFITSEPLLAKAQGSDPQTFLIADAGYNPYTTVVITSGKTLREKPQMVKAIVEACREGWRQYLDDPAATNAQMGALNLQMDAKTFAEAAAAQKPLIETEETKSNGLGAMTPQRWNVLAAQLASLKAVANPPKAEQCFTNPAPPAVARATSVTNPWTERHEDRPGPCLEKPGPYVRAFHLLIQRKYLR